MAPSAYYIRCRTVSGTCSAVVINQWHLNTPATHLAGGKTGCCLPNAGFPCRKLGRKTAPHPDFYLMFFKSRGTRSGNSPDTNTSWAAVFRVERGTALKGNSFGSCTFALDVILGAVGVVGDNTERLLIPYLQSLIALSVWGLALLLASCCGMVHWCFREECISYWRLETEQSVLSKRSSHWIHRLVKVIPQATCSLAKRHFCTARGWRRRDCLQITAIDLLFCFDRLLLTR